MTEIGQPSETPETAERAKLGESHEGVDDSTTFWQRSSETAEPTAERAVGLDRNSIGERESLGRDGEHPRIIVSDELDQHVRELHDQQGKLEAALAVNRVEGPSPYSRATNCGECARAVADTLDGHPVGAGSLNESVPDRNGEVYEGEYLTEMEDWAGSRFVPIADGTALGREVDSFREGEHAIVAAEPPTNRELFEQSGNDWGEYIESGRLDEGAEWADALEVWADQRGLGHFFNVAKLDGQSMIVDGQIGQADVFNAAQIDGAWANMEILRLQQRESGEIQ